MVQQVLALDPHTDAIFCFRGHKDHIIKILAHDDRGFCLLFCWPTTKDQVSVSLTKAELSLLLEGIDWRRPSKTYRPRLVG
ncbi:transposase [Mesorhizobium sp. M0590]